MRYRDLTRRVSSKTKITRKTVECRPSALLTQSLHSRNQRNLTPAVPESPGTNMTRGGLRYGNLPEICLAFIVVIVLQGEFLILLVLKVYICRPIGVI